MSLTPKESSYSSVLTQSRLRLLKDNPAGNSHPVAASPTTLAIRFLCCSNIPNSCLSLCRQGFILVVKSCLFWSGQGRLLVYFWKCVIPNSVNSQPLCPGCLPKSTAESTSYQSSVLTRLHLKKSINSCPYQFFYSTPSLAYIYLEIGISIGPFERKKTR